ncbi:MAG: glycosyltransferase [Scytonema sp. RU_4_4]|nr:glycosyltransferase [Scytonema sp. RU_4_4]
MNVTKNKFTNPVDKPIKIQIVSRDIPIENTVGNATYILDFIRYLRQAGCEIEYTLLNSSPNGKIPWYILPHNLAALTNVSARNNIRIGRILLRFNSLLEWLFAPLYLAYNFLLPETLKKIYRFARKKQQKASGHAVTSFTWDALATSEEVAFASSIFVKFKPHIVIANYAFLGNVLDSPAIDETVLKVILTHDVRHYRTAHFKKLGVTAFESDWSRETEIIELSKAQVLLAIQEEDAKVFQEMTPQCEVIHMPISAVCHTHNIKQVSGRCLFIGSNADHNLHGLQWFLKNVWSIILQSNPQCSLHVCGTVCDGIEETFPNVRFLGRVENLKTEYSSAQVCLVPLPVGSGLKIKLVEALSHGRACVSTSVGVQGLSNIVDHAVLVADTAEDFAAAVQTLLTHPEKRQRMEEQARKFVTEKLSPQAAYQPFVDRIEQHVQQVAQMMTEKSLNNELSSSISTFNENAKQGEIT